MDDNIYNPSDEEIHGEVVKSIARAVGKAIPYESEPFAKDRVDFHGPAFKPCTNVLPEKTGFWVKVKNIMLYEINVELTPYQQKIEDEINEFLHQEVSLKKVFNFFKEIPFGKKS